MENEQSALSLYFKTTPLFELTAILLAIVAILLALGGLYAYVNFRAVAKRQATEEAQKIAAKTAEAAAVKYMESEVPALIAAYMDLAQNAASDAQADDIAAAQENGRKGS